MNDTALEIQKIAAGSPFQSQNLLYPCSLEQLSEVESTVLEDTVVAWILDRAEVVTEPSSFDELLNPGQTRGG